MEKHEVIGLDFFHEDLFQLSLNKRDITHEIGDCLTLFNSDGTGRPYSISSSPEEDHLRFLIRRQPGGAVSDWLAQKGLGETIKTSRPYGWFRPGDSTLAQTKQIFFATGTGIAPFLAYFSQGNPSIETDLFYGCRKAEDLVLPPAEKINQSFIAISQEKKTRYHSGRITDLLEKVEISSDIHYYLCGLDLMIDEISEFLENRGISFMNIHREVFFHGK
ncbi:MAG: FAD-binding oxidoreductase [Lentisphaeria bacterium]|nr:FAD-binding oxidoreductase [Lentisphaeria bacterium]